MIDLIFQNGKIPLKITETTAEIEELRCRIESEKKSRQDLEKELELQVNKSLYCFIVIFLPVSHTNRMLQLLTLF